MCKGLVFLFGLSVLLVGCGTTAKFVYPADGKALTQLKNGPIYQKKVAVVPFEDMRGDKNQSGTYFLYLIPLMPCGWGEYQRPDAARMFNTVAEFDFDASEDLAKAAAHSLRKSDLFQDAFFTFGADKEKADYLLEGEMLSTTYKGTLWTYGLSAYGPLLWFFGLPAGTSYNELSLSITLKDISTGQPVWKKKYDVNEKIVQGLYYKMGHDVKGYSHLMQGVMNDAIADMNRGLQGKVQNQPANNTVAQSAPTQPVGQKVVVPEKTATLAQPSSGMVPKADIPTQLMKLKELKDAGMLTEAEFEAKRQALVGQLQ